MLASIAQFVKRTPFRKEIITVVILKLLALFLLWWLFFSDPVSKQLTTEDLGKHLMTAKEGDK